MLHIVLITKVKPSKQVWTVLTQPASPSVKLPRGALWCLSGNKGRLRDDSFNYKLCIFGEKHHSVLQLIIY